MLEYLHKFVINSALNIEVRKKFGIANTVTRTFLSPEPPLRLVTCREREVVEFSKSELYSNGNFGNSGRKDNFRKFRYSSQGFPL